VEKMEQVEGSPMFDFTAIEELDPSLVNGFRTIYDREVII
jgi:hypothetical protein